METTNTSRNDDHKYCNVLGALLLRHQYAEGDLYSEDMDIPSDWYEDDSYCGFMVPSKIRFSQTSISNVFSHDPHKGVPINALVHKLVKGKTKIEDVETLNVAVDNTTDKVYTLCNRRLWAFRETERRGKCKEIPVVIRPFWALPSRMFNTRNDGKSVRIRGSGSRAQSWSRPDSQNADCDKYNRRSRTKNRGNRKRRLVENDIRRDSDFSL